MLRSRYRRIIWFFFRAIASLIIIDLALSRLGFGRWVQRTRSQRLQRIAADFRKLAIEMGGVLIKVGQFLSSRVDVLPDEITSELAGLQDEVPPEDFEVIRQLAEAELGSPLREKFAIFEEQPLAAASLGQVHRAQLFQPEPGFGNGNQGVEVVVKVQRPNIEKIIATDLAALRTVGGWLQRYPPIRRRADIPSLLDEFTRILHEEIDYLAEGRNAETFGANFEDRPGVRVPRVVWSLTTRRVLTLEGVYAIKITDYQAITRAGNDRKQVASRLFQTYLRQIFEDNFFHADPHPGNLFVSPSPTPEDPTNWQLTFVDFGMVGRVPPEIRAGLRELVIAVGTQDADRLVRSYQMLGILLPHADLSLLKEAEAKAFERFWGKSMTELTEISLDEVLEFAREFRQIIYSLPFQIPQNLILLGRTVALLAGMCTGLDPQFNPWESIAPFAQRLVKEEMSSMWEVWINELIDLGRSLFNIPQRLDRVLRQIQQGEVVVDVPRISGQLSRLELAARRLVGALIFAALLMGGLQLYLSGVMIFSGVLLVGATIALGWVILSRPAS
jgi:predicted unusual protein kinase regulating ubiquinone biosynthesis (AarF/ABC1/UbiB family)